ncbi:UNVERIFIED_CONTAM: hypothetical protein FKN15_051143 [Acipenser sinensis]
MSAPSGHPVTWAHLGKLECEEGVPARRVQVSCRYQVKTLVVHTCDVKNWMQRPVVVFAEPERGSAHRYHHRTDSGGVKMNPRCPLKRVPSAARFFTHCRLAMQLPQSYSVGGQHSSGQLIGKPAGTRPDHKGALVRDPKESRAVPESEAQEGPRIKAVYTLQESFNQEWCASLKKVTELTCVKDEEVTRLECVTIKEEFIEQECVPIAEEVPAENNVCTLEENNQLGSSLCDDCPPECELGFRDPKERRAVPESEAQEGPRIEAVYTLQESFDQEWCANLKQVTELTCVKDEEVPQLECVPIKEEFIEQECVPIAEEVPPENNVCTLEENNQLGSSLCDDCPPECELGFRGTRSLPDQTQASIPAGRTSPPGSSIQNTGFCYSSLKLKPVKMDVSVSVSFFQDELASTIEHAVKAAVDTVLCEITKVVGGKFTEFQMEMAGKEKENESLKLRLEISESELKAVRECMNAADADIKQPLRNMNPDCNEQDFQRNENQGLFQDPTGSHAVPTSEGQEGPRIEAVYTQEESFDQEWYASLKQDTQLTCVKDEEVPRLECVPIKEEFIEQECVPIAEEVPTENNVCTLEENNQLGSSLCDDCPPECELGFRDLCLSPFLIDCLQLCCSHIFIVVLGSHVSSMGDAKSSWVAKGMAVIWRSIASMWTARSGSDLEIYSFHVDCKVTSRFAHNVITSRMANRANASREVTFDVELPKHAFISNFSMTIDGKTYVGVVKKKEEAKQQYDQAVSRGQSAGLVKVSGRKMEEFKVSVNIAALSKVTFELTYEELLKRHLGKYELAIKVRPQQLVKHFKIDAHIYEPQGISFLDAHAAFLTNDLAETVKKTLTQDKIVNGYFVHYFAPTDLPRMRKNVVFVIDRSGSMHGKKMQQTREALLKILEDIHEDDHFGLITFDSEVSTWKSTLVQATPKMVQQAKTFVGRITDRGGERRNGAEPLHSVSVMQPI